jgi:hypothetical protein
VPLKPSRHSIRPARRLRAPLLCVGRLEPRWATGTAKTESFCGLVPVVPEEPVISYKAIIVGKWPFIAYHTYTGTTGTTGTTLGSALRFWFQYSGERLEPVARDWNLSGSIAPFTIQAASRIVSDPSGSFQR